MNDRRRLGGSSALACAIAFAHFAGCASEPRCSEFSLDAVAGGAEIGVREAGHVRASYQREPRAAVSEEAAIYAKRLKTLCQLLWEGRITPEAYGAASADAYEAYQRSASERQRASVLSQ